MKSEWKKILPWGVAAFLLYLCTLYWQSLTGLIGKIFGAAIPIIFGFCIAYVVNLLMGFFERHYFPRSQKPFVQKSKRPACMILSLLILAAFIALIVWLIVPELVSCVRLLLGDLAVSFGNRMGEIINQHLLPHNFEELLASVNWTEKIGQIVNVVTSGLGGTVVIVGGVVTSIFSGFITVFLSIIFAIYFLSGKETLKAQASRLMDRFIKKPHRSERIKHVLSVMNQCFRRYIVGQVTEALILGALCTVGMLILQIPYASVVGALVTFMALIPIMGAYISAIVGSIIIFTVSPVKALVFLIFIILLQQVEGNVIYPKVVGTSLGLPGLWVLAAVTVGGGLFGIPGMILGVPLTATLYTLIKEKLNAEEDPATDAK